MRILLLPLLLTLAGCWNDNGDRRTLDLGNVSLGRQLIDLQVARDAGAISADEYAALKHALIDSVIRLSPAPSEKVAKPNSTD
jgi:hypothetical protein